MFEQALAKDERSMRALAGVSLVNSMNISFGWSKDPAASGRRSREALDIAKYPDTDERSAVALSSTS